MSLKRYYKIIIVLILWNGECLCQRRVSLFNNQLDCLKSFNSRTIRESQKYYLKVLENDTAINGVSYNYIRSNMFDSSTLMTQENNTIIIINTEENWSNVVMPSKLFDFSARIGETWYSNDSTVYRGKKYTLISKEFFESTADSIFTFKLDFAPRITDSPKLTEYYVSPLNGILAIKFEMNGKANSFCYEPRFKKHIRHKLKQLSKSN